MRDTDAWSFDIGAKAILHQSLFLDLVDVAIVELVPDMIVFGIGDVVACLGNAHVHNNSLEDVLGSWEVFEVIERELEVRVDLVAIVAYVLEPLQHEGQVGRK